MQYRLIIVDDMPVIVDSLTELFRRIEPEKLEVTGAYSAQEVLQLMNHKTDIVLTDIDMPGMDGIRLLELIRRQWPRCKVIFLTGYDYFEYAQKAVSLGAFEYILKTEGNEKVTEVVGKAMLELGQEMEATQFIDKAKQQLRRSLPSLRKDFMWELLNGKSPLDLDREFADMDVTLAADQPVHLLIGRVDLWEPSLSLTERSLLLYGVQNIAEELLSQGVRLCYTEYDENRIVWMIQPSVEGSGSGPLHDPAAWEETYRFVYGTLETIQSFCKQLLKISVSFVIGAEPVDWERLTGRFHQLQGHFRRGYGLYKESIMSDGSLPNEPKAYPGLSGSCSVRIEQLSKWLENGSREEFERELNADLIADRRMKEKADVGEYVVHKIRQFVAEHIHRYISLSEIADHVQLNRCYVSRLYKQVTGSNLYDDIHGMKLERAKKLLALLHLKVHEIAEQLGYLSSHSFIRFFKTHTGMTPQEYREQVSKSETFGYGTSTVGYGAYRHNVLQ